VERSTGLQGRDRHVAAGDLRAQLMFHYYHELSVYELGDPESAIASLRSIVAVDLPRDDLMILLLEQSLCFILSTRPEPQAQEEAYKIASEIIPRTNAMPWLLGASHDVLARVKLRTGRATEAEADARTACNTLVFAPAYVLASVSTLIYSLLAQGKPDQACQAAEEGLQRIQQVGCAGYNEVGLRLAASQAFHAAGNLDRARVELRDTLHQIQLRADDIRDPIWRNRYLNLSTESKCARELATTWKVDSSLA
jgi:hypothetical protein